MILHTVEYDSSYVPSEDDIKSFPDLQNGPSSLIQGSAVLSSGWNTQF